MGFILMVSSTCANEPVRIARYKKYKSLNFLQNYLNMDIVYKELLEEAGCPCPAWLEDDIAVLIYEVEKYRQRSS